MERGKSFDSSCDKFIIVRMLKYHGVRSSLLTESQPRNSGLAVRINIRQHGTAWNKPQSIDFIRDNNLHARFNGLTFPDN